MTVLIPFFVLLFLPAVATQNSSFCISNYAQLKQSLLEESSGNRERLLYAFKPPNRPTPHYLWAHYFHNHSANWSDVLECPQTSVLKACPEKNLQRTRSEEWEEIDHIIFWADSSLLINVDIPLLKVYTLDTLFDFLGEGSCVQLAIAPFCSTVNSETRLQLLQYATTVIRAYSTSNQESVRDYVLACEEKLSTESSYDSYIFACEVTVAVGSLVLYAVLCFKWSQDAKSTNLRTLCVFKRPCLAQQRCVRWSSCATFKCGKKIASLLLIVNVSAALILVLDFAQISVNHGTLGKLFFRYYYSTLNTILFGLTIVTFSLTAVVGCPTYILIFCKSDFRCKCEIIQIVFLTSLTAVSFSYVVTRAYMLSLLIFTYPFEVGFIVLTIGSAYAALTFVILTTVHIVIIKCTSNSQAKMYPVITEFIPYVCLLVILIGLMTSYISMVLRQMIRARDPVTSLVAALVPTAIGFVAANRFESEKRFIEQFGNGSLEASVPPTTKIPPLEDKEGTTSSRSTAADTRNHSQGDKRSNFAFQNVAVSLSEMDIQQPQEDDSSL